MSAGREPGGTGRAAARAAWAGAFVLAATLSTFLVGRGGRGPGALAAGLSALSAAAIVFASARRREQRAREITAAAERIGRGDLEVRAPVRGPRELRALARTLNRTASELSRSLEELRAERDRLASVLEGMFEGVLVTDDEGRIALANGALRAMTKAGEDATGGPVLAAIRSAELKEVLDAAAANPEPLLREIELPGPRPRKARVRARRLDGGGVVAVLQDVTKLRRLETMRRDFVANVSHELRTPIAAISAAAETLSAGALGSPEDARTFVEVIERHAARLRQLVDDLLDLAKIESRAFRPTLADVDAGEAIDRVLELFSDQARRKGVSLERVPPGPATARVRADLKALEQVLSNLLDNAIKYAGEGARVSVSVRCEPGAVVFSVEDDGPGIARVHLARIFERFYRVEPGRSRELGGTGLGLSIVKHLVESMGGEVSVESEVGRGSRFSVRLPAPP